MKRLAIILSVYWRISNEKILSCFSINSLYNIRLWTFPGRAGRTDCHIHNRHRRFMDGNTKAYAQPNQDIYTYNHIHPNRYAHAHHHCHTDICIPNCDS